MSQRIVLIIMLVGSLVIGAIVAQEPTDFATFQPQESFVTFDYPATWQVREEGQVIALYSDESVLPLRLSAPLDSGQFKILLAYLTPAQREQANIAGTTPETILQSVIARSDVAIEIEGVRRYEFNRRLTVRSDFANPGNQGAVWIMEMADDGIVMMQVVTATDELIEIEGAMIELLRSLQLTTVREYLFAIADLERSQPFSPEKTRLVFDYPVGWEVNEPNNNTVVLTAPQTQLSLQFFDYTDLSRQGVPIDDPAAVLQSLQSRSDRPEAFAPIQQVTVNNQILPYSPIVGDDFIGTSLGRDIKIGFLWITLLTGDQSAEFDYNTLAWALLLTTQFQVDPVALTERVTMPQHQFEFYHPSDWLIREVSPSSYILGTSQTMIDEAPDSLQFTEDAQLLVQVVSASDYAVARADTTATTEVLEKFTQSTSDLTTYDTPITLTLGEFTFAQVDFDNPNYSGTALLTPMADGGALWIQLRTPPNDLGDWEPIALAIARSSRIFTLNESDGSNLDAAIFDALNAQPTAIPTPTRDPDAPPDLGDVLGEVVATPAPVLTRQLNFELPLLESTYTTNYSEITSHYPRGWLVQEDLPSDRSAPSYENTISMSNNANLLLVNELEIKEGDAEIFVQYTRYADLIRFGFIEDNLLDLITSITATFEDGTYDAPLQFRINGDMMVIVTASTSTRQSVALHQEMASGEGYVKVELIINPRQLELWLPTAVAIMQSVQVP